MAKEFNWEKCGAIGQWVIGIVGFVLWGIDHASKPQSSQGTSMSLMQWLPPILIAIALALAGAFHLKAATIKKREISASTGQPVKSGGRSQPIIGVTLHDAVVEDYDHTPGRHYPRKLGLYLSNEGDDIELGKGNWIAEGVGLQAGKPSTCEYQIKDHLGQWSAESPIKMIPSGKWFRLYIGLDSGTDEQKLKSLAKEHKLGVIQIPARADGSDLSLRYAPSDLWACVRCGTAVKR
jgi:hypothetical protein